MGEPCRVTAYALLKLMGKTDTGKNRTTLHNRIERLVANAVTVKQGRYTYIGGLIRFAAKDEETQEWVIELDAKLRPLFAADQFAPLLRSINPRIAVMVVPGQTHLGMIGNTAATAPAGMVISPDTGTKSTPTFAFPVRL